MAETVTITRADGSKERLLDNTFSIRLDFPNPNTEDDELLNNDGAETNIKEPALTTNLSWEASKDDDAETGKTIQVFKVPAGLI